MSDTRPPQLSKRWSKKNGKPKKQVKKKLGKSNKSGVKKIGVKKRGGEKICRSIKVGQTPAHSFNNIYKYKAQYIHMEVWSSGKYLKLGCLGRGFDSRWLHRIFTEIFEFQKSSNL